MAKGAAKYRVRVLVPCYKEEVGVLRQTLLRAIRALHVGQNEIAEVGRAATFEQQTTSLQKQR